MIATPNDPDQRMTVAVVRFAPGARTAWHSHARGQYLRVTQGVARFGRRDGTIIEVHPGQTLYTPPGEDHWHAAAGGCFMEHIVRMPCGGQIHESPMSRGSCAHPFPPHQRRWSHLRGTAPSSTRQHRYTQ